MTEEVFNCPIIKKIRRILWIGTNFPLSFSCLKNSWRFWSRILIPWRLVLVTRGISYYNLRFLKKKTNKLLIPRGHRKRFAPTGPKSKSTGCLITLTPSPLSADASLNLAVNHLVLCARGHINEQMAYSQILGRYHVLLFTFSWWTITVVSAHIVVKLWTKMHSLSFEPRRK